MRVDANVFVGAALSPKSLPALAIYLVLLSLPSLSRP